MSKEALLDFIRPFRIGSGRRPGPVERAHLERLLRELAEHHARPRLSESFGLLAGTWECLYTDSRYVLDLDKIPLLRLCRVFQEVHLDPSRRRGHYFNMGELSRAGAVRMVCGERARIEPSQREGDRLNVRYESFYSAFRPRAGYEGHVELARSLEENRCRRAIRLPFHKSGWQSVIYLDESTRVVRGNEGGIFVLARMHDRRRMDEAGA